MATREDNCSQWRREEDSFLITESSGETTPSLSSTSMQSGSNSSLDEGVETKETKCKKIFSDYKLFNENRLPEIQDQPIDLSMKKMKTSTLNRAPVKNTLAPTNFEHAKSRKDNSELVINEDIPFQRSKSPTKQHLCSDDNTPMSIIPRSLAPPTYIPWSYNPRPRGLSLSARNLSSLWHPALLMTQAGRHLASGISPYVFTSTPNLTSPIASTDAFQQFYDQNVLAEFSRICLQAKQFCEPKMIADRSIALSRPEESSSTEKNLNTHRNTIGKMSEKYGHDLHTKLERQSPDSSTERKRKLDKDFIGSSFRLPNETFNSACLRKRIRDDFDHETFQLAVTGPDSPPTMVGKESAMSGASGRTIPKPVDFKPCRFPCNECGRTYATVGGLLKHSKSHHDCENSTNFKCKTCDKEYNSLGALKMHIRTHTLPCKCHICGKAFSRTWLLQGHIRTHTGEKPYQCTVCSRAFADRSNLRAHMQTHESVKRYACTSCDKTFSRISLLSRHQVSGCVGSS